MLNAITFLWNLCSSLCKYRHNKLSSWYLNECRGWRVYLQDEHGTSVDALDYMIDMWDYLSLSLSLICTCHFVFLSTSLIKLEVMSCFDLVCAYANFFWIYVSQCWIYLLGSLWFKSYQWLMNLAFLIFLWLCPIYIRHFIKKKNALFTHTNTHPVVVLFPLKNIANCCKTHKSSNAVQDDFCYARACCENHKFIQWVALKHSQVLHSF